MGRLWAFRRGQSPLVPTGGGRQSVDCEKDADSCSQTSLIMIRESVINRLYGQVLRGLPGLGTPEETAQAFLRAKGTPREAAGRLCRRYTGYSALTGFVCGLPGYVSMTVTVPANVGGVLLLQLHMCASMAVLGDRDPKDDEVRKLAVGCVLDVFKGGRPDGERRLEGLLSRVSIKLAERGVRFVSEQAIRWVGRRSRSLPLLGGVIGGYTDLHSTREVGEGALRLFLVEEKG